MKSFKNIIKYILQVISTFTPLFIRKQIMRIIGFKIGKRVKIGMFSLIIVENMELDDDACIDPFTIIVLLKKLKVGKKSRIAYFTKIYGKGTFIAEARCLVSVQCLIECMSEHKVIMKDYSCFGPRNTIYTHGGYLPDLQGYPSKKGDVEIGKYSWTGMCTSILPGTKIGNNTIIAPGAVLTGKIASNRFIRPYAYKHEEYPIENKIIKRPYDEIMHFIENVVSIVMMNKNKYQNVDLYKNIGLVKIDKYLNKYVVFVKNNEISEIKKDTIYIGFDLCPKIKLKADISWIDFKDYSAYPESNKTLNKLIHKLYKSKYCLRFIIIK